MKRPASPTRVASCPRPDVLAQLVSGSLNEQQAEELFSHVGGCPSCQDHADELARRADGLLGAARKKAAAPADPERLGRLIRDAQQIHRETLELPRHARPGTPRVTLDVFLSCLRQSGLVDDAQVSRMVDTVGPSDSETFARELLSKRLLTPFQAKALLRGRWKGLVLGKYVVLEKLGEGGMGQVFKARHERMGRTVCLKVLHANGRRSPAAVKRFRHEARTAAALNHPNIVVAHDADEADGIPFLVMEFVAGSDLARRVEADGPLPLNEALEAVRQVARALEYAHARGVVHRDIKPHNLLLTPPAEESDTASVKILDMGLARFDTFLGECPDASTHGAMTQTGVVMGTVDYMSPEQALNSRHADARSDIYSLGCTLHFLLTGRPPYDAETLMGRLIAHREQAPPELDVLGAADVPGLNNVFHRMISKDPDKRYSTMAEVADDVTALLDGRRPATGPVNASAAGSLPTVAVRESETSAEGYSRSWKRRRLQASRETLMGSLIAGLVIVGVVAASVTLHAMLGDDGEPTTTAGVGTVRQPGTDPGAAGSSRSYHSPRIVGHPNTLKNGGAGRAMVVVAYSGFHEHEYRLLSQALGKRGVDVVTVSSKQGRVGDKNRKVWVETDMSLEDFHAQDFDAVVFCGGATHEFTHKSPAVAPTVRRIVNESLDAGLVVSGLSDGWCVLAENDLCSKCSLSPHPKHKGLQIGRPDSRAGALVKMDSKMIGQFVTVTFDEILKWRVPSKPVPARMSGRRAV